jgi:hypothetical protein
MIKFFRKIRQRLLTENKFSKYLLYAIGEITLVVIGILIALQINNWNEDNKNKSAKLIYSKRLLDDISINSVEYDYFIKLLSNRQEKISSYRQFIKNGGLTLEQLNDSLSNYGHFKMGYNPASATYNDLISTGNIVLFSNDEKDAIFNYYRILEYFEETIDANEVERNNERTESLRYLNKDTLNFYESINFKRDQSQIVQGLKHRLNEMDKETEIFTFLRNNKELYFDFAKYADSTLTKK